MKSHIRIGTRSSQLALWQANYVAGKLKDNGYSVELVHVQTKGDKMINKPIAKIGSKGVFTEELETQLLNHEIDLAVHSAKDVQTELNQEFRILAFCKRERVNDVVISNFRNFRLSDTSKNWLIGTSSTRRIGLIKHYFPHLKLTDLRGNIQTRFSKLNTGNCDAMILAFAGIHRLNYDSFIVEDLSTDVFTPPAGQGSICIEVLHENNDINLLNIRNILNDNETEICINSERHFMSLLGGGCSVPIFCYAEISEKIVNINAGIVHPAGKEIVREHISGFVPEHKTLVERLSRKVLDRGGKQLINNN